MTYQVIIPAAGQGKRMRAGKNKILLELQRQPIFIHTLRVFELDHNCEGIYLAVNTEDDTEIKKLLNEYGIKKVKALAPGGKERQHSIHNALKYVKQEGIILVHDAARPFIDAKLLEPLVKAAEEKGAAILAVPVKDTVKKVTENVVAETIERTSLWAVQTPQAFRFAILMNAYEKAEADHFLGTDDASLVERMGQDVVIVEGNYDNIKLTTQEDLYFAEAIMQKRNKSEHKNI